MNGHKTFSQINEYNKACFSYWEGGFFSCKKSICISLILLLPSTASGLFSSPTIKQDNVINGHFSHFESVVDHPTRVHNLIECNIKCAVCKMKTDKGPTPPTITFPGNRYQPPSLAVCVHSLYPVLGPPQLKIRLSRKEIWTNRGNSLQELRSYEKKVLGVYLIAAMRLVRLMVRSVAFSCRWPLRCRSSSQRKARLQPGHPSLSRHHCVSECKYRRESASKAIAVKSGISEL